MQEKDFHHFGFWLFSVQYFMKPLVYQGSVPLQDAEVTSRCNDTDNEVTTVPRRKGLGLFIFLFDSWIILLNDLKGVYNQKMAFLLLFLGVIQMFSGVLFIFFFHILNIKKSWYIKIFTLATRAHRIGWQFLPSQWCALLCSLGKDHHSHLNIISLLEVGKLMTAL